MSRYQHTPAETRIRAALSQMPYGGLSTVSTASHRVGFRDGVPIPIDLDDVAAYLEALAGELKPIGDDNHQLQIEHRRLLGDIEAVRRVFGLTP